MSKTENGIGRGSPRVGNAGDTLRPCAPFDLSPMVVTALRVLARIIHKPSTTVLYLPALGPSSSLANPQAVEKHASAVLHSAPLTATYALVRLVPGAFVRLASTRF